MAAPSRLLASISPAAVGLAAAAGAGVVAFNMSKPYSSPAEPKKSLGQKPVFPAFGFVNLTLAEARMVNHDTRELKFKLPEDEAASGLSPVSSLLTRHTAAGSWFPTLRPYTPISTPDSPYITLLVKQYPNGRASTHLHKLEPGQTLSVKSIPELSYKQNQYKHLVLVAGGAGITPMFQALRSVLDNPEDKTRVSLVYANKTEPDILLKTELDDLASRYPQRFTTTYVVNDSRVTDKSLEKGYVTKDILSKALPAEIDGDDIKIMVCGPPAMLNAVAGAKGGMGWAQGKLGGMLKDLGFTEKQVHKF
ncbi:cytochrome-b5 reductase [Aureobasidium subglaciale]|nr:cytochrome-b5 reductase [Aureobasidium subglaciale]KAI5213333.1 cytochrome-b5 reductase [Aureobasidium subglaciale]KAI5214727.1 cytochrome-b5 reductase [Aureobasidium subglaciale]KAI5252735.1 cytochrome-b5 reductase [Aureobasidium subglaciale]